MHFQPQVGLQAPWPQYLLSQEKPDPQTPFSFPPSFHPLGLPCHQKVQNLLCAGCPDLSLPPASQASPSKDQVRTAKEEETCFILVLPSLRLRVLLMADLEYP